eukprot:s938_g13.t2
MSESAAASGPTAGDPTANQNAAHGAAATRAVPVGPNTAVHDTLPDLRAARAALKRELKQATSAIKNEARQTGHFMAKLAGGAGEVESGTRGCGPAVPTAIWSWQRRSGRVHCDLELAGEARQCPLRLELAEEVQMTCCCDASAIAAGSCGHGQLEEHAAGCVWLGQRLG